MTSPGPIAFEIFGLDIRWYGILVAAGMMAGVFVASRRFPDHGIPRDGALDIAVFALPAAVIGARLYYVIFSWQNYSGDISEIFDIRSGGLAVHGGIIGGILAAYFVCRYKKWPFLSGLDATVPGIALGQAIGRWGNFFNSEAHGGPTDLPWAIEVGGESVHPTFLYESVWCFLLFIFLFIFDKKRRSFTGQTTCLYGMLYSFERFFVEGLRTDSLMIGPLRQAQLISGIIFLACALAYGVLYKRSKRQNQAN